MQDIAANLARVQKQIAAAADRAGRDPSEVTVVAVSKTRTPDEIRAAWRAGVRHIGENRVEEAEAKRPQLDLAGVTWHMIGSVQRRKAKDVARLFNCVDSVDRYELAEALDKRCEARDRPMPVLIEVNVSGEAAKHGYEPDELDQVLERVGDLRHLQVEGLMTMAPFVPDPEMTRPVFAGLRRLAERVGLSELSMGMSNDFEVAIEEGATQVRIGSLLFA